MNTVVITSIVDSIAAAAAAAAGYSRLDYCNL